METAKETQYYKSYIAGYRDGVKDALNGKIQMQSSSDPAKYPIQAMGLSTRAANCLIRAGCQPVADVLSLEEDSIRRMRNLGTKTALEIAAWLVDHYYFSSVWVQYL